jgi:hypothetical protein
MTNKEMTTTVFAAHLNKRASKAMNLLLDYAAIKGNIKTGQSDIFNEAIISLAESQGFMEDPYYVGEVNKDGFLYVYCDCGERHEHGKGSGLRVSHCSQDNPNRLKSYYVRDPRDIQEL